jgi:hypothetical protein
VGRVFHCDGSDGPHIPALTAVSCNVTLFVKIYFSAMALPFETRTVDERIQDRAEKARERGTWPLQTGAEKIIYDMAVFVATEKEALEAGFRIRNYFDTDPDPAF